MKNPLPLNLLLLGLVASSVGASMPASMLGNPNASPATRLEGDSAFALKYECLNGSESEFLRGSRGLLIEKRACVPRSIGYETCHFRDVLLVRLSGNRPSDNHAPDQYSIVLSRNTEPVPNDGFMVAMVAGDEVVRFNKFNSADSHMHYIPEHNSELIAELRVSSQ